MPSRCTRDNLDPGVLLLEQFDDLLGHRMAFIRPPPGKPEFDNTVRAVATLAAAAAHDHGERGEGCGQREGPGAEAD